LAIDPGYAAIAQIQVATTKVAQTCLTHPEVESTNLETTFSFFDIGPIHDVQPVVAIAGKK
jgi:hypothetical protein